jgi:phosphoribosylglycinamide formyltransferase 1
MLRIAIFASGKGSNASKIIEHFKISSIATVELVVSNKPEAGVVSIAKNKGIPTLIIDKEKFFKGNGYVDELAAKKIDLIVLAGFLWKIPQTLINAFPRRIINIHPALLPKYGGKGMYGDHVHQAVIDAGEEFSGITIHYVDDVYDHGEIIFQQKCPLPKNATSQSLAECVHELEHEYYPLIIEDLAKKLI